MVRKVRDATIRCGRQINTHTYNICTQSRKEETFRLVHKAVAVAAEIKTSANISKISYLSFIDANEALIFL